MAVPEDPRIFHITHIDNLPSILRSGGLWCDAERIARGVANTNIGHAHIKDRRLRCPVRTAAGGMLGDYVPFNFCPRSVMLYVVSKGHQDYRGGQQNVLHLVSTVHRAVALDRTPASGARPWAFTDRHAELGHALHYDDLSKLSEIAWPVMRKRYWMDVMEERQAEFLVQGFFPWAAVIEVAAMTSDVAAQARSALDGMSNQPPVTVRPEWYY